MSTPTVSAQAIALTADDVQRIGLRLPSALPIFRRIGGLLSDPNGDLNRIVEAVKLDAALALRILHVSNSAYYGFDSACDSLDGAINRLGFREVYRLAGVVSSQQLYCRDLPVHRVSGQLVWENSLASALAMEWLARQAGGDQAAAYALGLLRSVGKIALARVPIEWPTISCEYPGEAVEPSLPAWERRMFGMSGTEVAAVLMRQWNFPVPLYEAVQWHLEPESAPESLEANRLNLAAWIAAQVGKCLPGEAGAIQLRPDRLAHAGLTGSLLQQGTVETGKRLEGLLAQCK